MQGFDMQDLPVYLPTYFIFQKDDYMGRSPGRHKRVTTVTFIKF